MKSPALTNSARGKACTFRLPGVCNCNRETTVFCHAPSRSGMGMKSPDYWGAYGCYECHKVMDRQDKRFIDFDLSAEWLRAISETQKQLANDGLLIFSEKIKRPKKAEKVIRNQGIYRAKAL